MSKIVGTKYPRFYTVTRNSAAGTLRLASQHIAMGKTIPIARGWDRWICEGLQIKQINPYGNISLRDGVFTPELGRETAAANLRGQMIGALLRYNRQGNLLAEPTVIPLGNYQILDRVTHVESVIEMVPLIAADGLVRQLEVVERALDATTPLTIDRSKYLYTFSDLATRQLEEAGLYDLKWITDVRVKKNSQAHEASLIIHFTAPGGATGTITISARELTDNYGKPLLGNPELGMGKEENVFQSSFYPEETKRFRPEVTLINGQLRLVVHKVTRRKIDLPTPLALKSEEVKTTRIFPTAADAAAEVEIPIADGKSNKQWIPITLKDPLDPKLVVAMIDYAFSKVIAGQVKSAIGPQQRPGESDNISSEYPRDPYFYGLTVFALFKQLERWGESFAINRNKAVRAFRGIESGRTHVERWDLIFDEFADFMETNCPFYHKLSSYAHELNSPGVSEDTQKEIATWLRGVRMWVVKEMVAIMQNEKEWGRYKIQNAERYNYSEVLFVLSALIAKCDVIEARVLNKKPKMMSWAEISEILAGRTWYKLAIAEVIKMSAIPAYLLSFGHVLFYPVDLQYFIAAWMLRTVASGANYTMQLWSIGYNFATGFFRNPSIELSFGAGYLRAALRQFLDRPQYGTFMATVGGTGAVIPKEYINYVKYPAIALGTAISVTAGLAVLGGLASWLILPAGAVGVFGGTALLRSGYNADNRGKANPLGAKGLWQKSKRAIMMAGGTLAAIGGATAVVLGTPAVLANFLSIAIVVNLSFGLYLFSLLAKTLHSMNKAIKAKMAPAFHKRLEDSSISLSEMFQLTKTQPGDYALRTKRGETIIKILESLGILYSFEYTHVFYGKTKYYNLVSRGLIRKETLPTAEFDKVKDLFINPDLSVLAFKPGTKRETIEKLEISSELKSALLSALDLSGSELIALAKILIEGNTYLAKLSNKEKTRIYELLQHKHRLDERIFAALMKHGYITEITSKDKDGKEVKKHQVTDRIKDGAVALRAALRQELGDISDAEVQLAFGLVWDRLPLSMELKDQNDPDNDQNSANVVKRLYKIREELLQVPGRTDPNGTSTLKLEELLARREELFQILRRIKAMDISGQMHQGVEHPYRVVSHLTLELLHTAEMTIIHQAANLLRQDPKNAAAREAILKILRRTREFEVVQTASALYRRYNLKL